MEVELESESGEDGERLEEAGKALVGIQEVLEEQNALCWESNQYLKGIMWALLEGNKLLSREPVDSTLKEWNSNKNWVWTCKKCVKASN